MEPIVALDDVLYFTELIGVVAFAIAGALRAVERKMDVFGVLVLAIITALGGGIIRDILADRFPVSLAEPVYFYTAVIGGALGFAGARLIVKYQYWLKIFDALGLAVFSVLGAQVALAQNLNVLSVLLLGLLTGIGGGVVRDVLANDVPLVLRKEVYALASLLGIAVLWMLVHCGMAQQLAIVLGAVVVFGLRIAAIRWNLNLPVASRQRYEEHEPDTSDADLQ